EPRFLALGRVACPAIGQPDRITAIARESLTADIDRRTALGEAQPQREAGAVGAQPRHRAVERAHVVRLKAFQNVGEAARRPAQGVQRAGKEAFATRAKEVKRGRAAAERGAELVEAGDQPGALSAERGNAQALAIDGEAGNSGDRQNKPEE